MHYFSNFSQFCSNILNNLRGKLPTKNIIFDAMLYSIQNLLSYALMLVAMTYSFYLFAAVILGMVIGKKHALN